MAEREINGNDLSLELERKFPYFPPELREDMMQYGMLAQLEAGKEILKEGQFVKVLPLVLEGSLRVFLKNENKELLLYFIEPRESCVMSFSSILSSSPSKIFAETETDCKVVLLPIGKIKSWTETYPAFNLLFLKHYQHRYEDMLTTINQVMFESLETRLIDYLKLRTSKNGNLPIQLTHTEMAKDLGTSREVITRMLKKLEVSGRIEISEKGIKFNSSM
ncbi:MAG: Crp/Fnr family transcriptional regulator [Saprospiraceae bacterium]